ncbi:MAG: hypothetical protein HZB25_03515 [Candidatus Eisenbacteria bacterium]|nr:hypothetical protein [Candidatus Eisenbacteria bacterium]
MKNLLRTAVCAALLTATLAGMASAGQNAGATARIYWLTNNTLASTDRNSTSVSATQKLLVTVKGVNTFRGADVQLLANAMDASGLPLEWQGAIYTPKAGGWNTGSATVFPSIALASPSLSLSSSQTGDLYYGLTGTSACVTPHNVGTFWYSAAGAAGRARDTNIEYGVFGLVIDLSAVAPTPGVCINPNYRLPCGTGEQGNKIVIVDGNTLKDYCAFDLGYQWLTWSATGPGCPDVTPVQGTTWGKIRHLYK